MTRLFLALLVLFSINVHAQQYTRTILGDSVNKSTKLKAERFKTMWDGKIKGKRYYNETFILGKVNDESYYLRYDQYADQFEAKRQQEQEAPHRLHCGRDDQGQDCEHHALRRLRRRRHDHRRPRPRFPDR